MLPIWLTHLSQGGIADRCLRVGEYPCTVQSLYPFTRIKTWRHPTFLLVPTHLLTSVSCITCQEQQIVIRSSVSISAEFEVGVLVPKSICSYTVNVANKRTGFIQSPTYPGAYPKDLICTYQFIGRSNQRIRLEFRDFDLFFGGPQ